MTDATAIISVAGLSYEYPGLRALDNVSFTIPAGRITALVGPNGAGKTTLLRCLAGLTRPLAGAISINGVDVIEEPRRSHRSIGYLSDFFGLYEDLSVRQSLAYVAAANGASAEHLDQLVERTAAELGLVERLDQRAGDLSRGLRQRVAIAQAVIHGPAVILLDEPAAGLDPEARYALGELFLQLRARGISLLVSSHILAELEAYSTDMLILRNGRVLEQRRLGGTELDQYTVDVEVVGEPRALLAALDDNPTVLGVVPTDSGAQFGFSGTAAARAELLAGLLGAGVEVAHFAVLGEDLQQSYLNSIKQPERRDES